MKISEFALYLIKKSKREIISLMLMAYIIMSLMAKCQSDNYRDNMESFLLDSLHKTTNKLGQEISSRKVLKESYSDLKRQARSSNDEIKRLKSIVDKKTQTAVIIKNHTIIKEIAKTDTIYKDVLGWPIYKTDKKDRWKEYSIVSGRDSTTLNIKLLNEYEIKHQWKKSHLELTVKNLNPNTYTDNIISYTVQERKKKIGLGVQAGYGVGRNGITPYIGIGISYNIIRF
jgi:opacity protein-like surface antigen